VDLGNKTEERVGLRSGEVVVLAVDGDWKRSLWSGSSSKGERRGGGRAVGRRRPVPAGPIDRSRRRVRRTAMLLGPRILPVKNEPPSRSAWAGSTFSRG